MTGQVIHNYRIVEKLGQGGMGTVYKAVDVRLNRPLALKFVSPERVTPDRKRRFFQEAKAASALNHPNIVHIYDIGQWEGADFIAMEYVEGRTLQQILRDGPLPIDEALRYAIQVADAIAAAHAANIIHRDLKPANVMITGRGLAKILDFGVAKLSDPGPAHAAEAGSPEETQTLANVDHTMEGAVVGSPSYMSPEQASGKPVDARSDIFEFGLLLHEMLTGKVAFGGGSRIEILSAILHTDPARPSSINPNIPPEVEWVIAHCLRKDREKRFQSMSEVKVALEDLRTETSVTGMRAHTLSATNVSTSSVAPALAPPKTRTWLWGIGIAVALGCTTILALLLLLRPWKQSPARTAVGTAEITRITTEGGLAIDPTISSDGKLLAYASDRSGDGNFDIWLRQIGGGDAVRLTHDPADDVEPDFSSDGTKIVFRSTRQGGGLYIIPTLGGEERKIVDGGRQPRFSPDGFQIAYWVGPADANPLREGLAHAYILDLRNSQTRRLRGDFPASMQPVWSPDGKRIVFVGLKDAKDIARTFDWWITPLDGSPAVMFPVIGYYFTPYPFAWRGDRIYFAKDEKGRITIGEVGVNPKTWKPAGGLQALTTGTTDEYSPSVSKDGKLVFSSILANSDLYSLPVDANHGKPRGTPQRLTKEAGSDIVRSISADGKRVAFISDRSGVTQVWAKDLVTGQERALTAGGTEKGQPQISPDGQLVAWRENDFVKHQIFVTPFTGGIATQVCDDCGMPTGWSADGRYLLYRNRASDRTFVGFLEIATQKKTDFLKRDDQQFGDASFSRDGKWIVFAAFRTSRDFTIYVAPFSPDRTAPKSEWVEILQSPEVDPDASWSPDGDLLYFTSERDGFNCLWAQRLDPSTKRPQCELFAVQHFHVPSQVLVAPAFGHPVALGPDKVVVSLNERSGGIWMLKLEN